VRSNGPWNDRPPQKFKPLPADDFNLPSEAIGVSLNHKPMGYPALPMLTRTL
jgi:hypothetical protein